MHLEIVPKDTMLEAARMQFSILRKSGGIVWGFFIPKPQNTLKQS